MIVDREGEPIAQNQVAYQVALQYRQFENADRDFVINWARTRLDSLQALVQKHHRRRPTTSCTTTIGTAAGCPCW